VPLASLSAAGGFWQTFVSVSVHVGAERADLVHVLDRTVAGGTHFSRGFLARARLVHQRGGFVLVGDFLGTQHQFVGAGAHALYGGENLDAAVGRAVEGLDVVLGKVQAFLEIHFEEILGTLLAVRPAVIPNPTAGAGAHAGAFDGFHDRGQVAAARFGETSCAAADHFRHQALRVPVFVFGLGGRKIGVAPVFQPVAGFEVVRNEPAGDFVEVGVAIDETGHDQAVSPVDDLLAGVFFLDVRGLADRNDAVAADGHRTVGENASGGVHGEQDGAFNENVDCLRHVQTPENEVKRALALASSLQKIKNTIY